MKNYDMGVGWPVQFFEDGTSQTAPHPAFVSYSHKSNMVDLVVFDRYGGDARSKKSVRHVSDPILESNPVIRSEDGAWDFIPGFPEPAEKLPSVRIPGRGDIQPLTVEEFECLQAAMAVGEPDYAAIAKKLRRPGWNAQKVQEFLERHEVFANDKK